MFIFSDEGDNSTQFPSSKTFKLNESFLLVTIQFVTSRLTFELQFFYP